MSEINDVTETSDSTPEQVSSAPPVAVIDLHPQSSVQNTPANTEVFSLSRDSINYVILAAVFLVLGVVLGMNIGDSGINETKLRTIVKDEIQIAMSSQLEGLESAIVAAGTGGNIDPEALAALIQSAVDEALIAQVDFMEDDDPYIGPEDAPVIMVEFSDFLCTFCGRHYDQTLSRILEDYEGYVRYVYRDFPGVGGQNAVTSALAAECANDQGKFWEYHNILFESTEAISVSDQAALREVLISFAGNLSLDTDAFTTCLESQTHMADVIQDASDAQAVGARGTPGFVINGTFVSGAQPYEVFAGLINAELKEKGIEYTPPNA